LQDRFSVARIFAEKRPRRAALGRREIAEAARPPRLPTCNGSVTQGIEARPDTERKEEEMFGKTHTMRRITMAIVATSLATWAAAPALPFDGRSPDARDAAGQGEPSSGSAVVEARSPNTRDAGGEAIARFSVDARSPDTREAGEQAKPSVIVDGRSPDSRDAGQRFASALSDAWVGVFSGRPDPGASPTVADAWLGMLAARPQPGIPAVEVGSSDRFHWGEFGIGVGVALGSMLLVAGLAASALVARQKRDARTGAATT
jgi:hypothetical protein